MSGLIGFGIACGIRVAFVTLVACFVATILRRGPASWRHLVCSIGFVSALLTPAAFISLPKHSVQMPAAVNQVSFPHAVVAPRAAVKEGRIASTTRAQAVRNTPLSRSIDVWEFASVIYLLGLFLLATRWLGSLTAARRAVTSSSPWPNDLGTLPPNVALRQSSSATVPMTFWWGKHIVLLPDAAASWPTAQVEAAVLHELAHVRRGDFFTQTASLLACALYWPVPFVWWLSREARSAAETAADDQVLASGLSAPTYAEHLLATAAELRAKPSSLAVAMTRRPDVGSRVRDLLDSRRSRIPTSAPVLVVAALLGGACLTAANSVVLGQIRSAGDPKSRFEEVRTGTATPGTSENNFTATFVHGRKVQLVAVGRHIPRGVLEVWNPDGTPIHINAARFETISIQNGKGPLTERYLYYRCYSPKRGDYLWTEVDKPDRTAPSSLFLGGGGTILPGGETTPDGLVIQRVDLRPGPQWSRAIPIALAIASGGYDTQARITFDKGGKPSIETRTIRPGKDGSPKGTDICELRDLHAKLSRVRNGDWAIDVHYKAPSLTEITPQIKHGPKRIYGAEQVSAGVDEDRGPLTLQFSERPSTRTWIDVNSRKLHVSEFLGVHLQPNKAKP